MQPTRKRPTRALLLAGAVGVASLPAIAFAADAPSSQVQEIVVTAQRRSESIQQVPVSVQAFTGKALTDLGVKSSADLAQVTPNMDIALPAGPGNQPIITIRGIGLNDYDTNNAGPNGIYVDEVYLSSPASQTFQTFDLQRIEVLKGPQGTLYGRNTSGGAINFISVKPSDTPEGDLHFEYGSFNTVNVEGGFGGPITPTLDGRAALVINESDGDGRNLLTGGHVNGVNNMAGRIQLLWKPMDNLKVLWNIHGGFVDNLPTEYRHIGAFAPGTQASASPTVCSVSAAYAGQCVDLFGYGTPSNFYDGEYNRTKHLKVNSFGSSLRLDYAFGKINLTSLTSFEHNDKIHPEDSDASPNRLLEIDFGVRSNTITQEFRAAGSGSNYEWVGGVYYLHEDLHQNQPIYLFLDGDTFGLFGSPAGPGAADGIATVAYDQSHQVTDAYAVFGQGDYEVVKNLKVTLGGRYTSEHRSFAYDSAVTVQSGGMDNFPAPTPLVDSTDSFNKSAFSWRAAVDYHFTPQIHAYASVATGYKSGDFNGSFLSLDPTEIALQLKPVAPETVTAYEVGLKSSLFENRVVFDVAAFYNDYRDMQVFELVPPVAGGSGLPVNVLDNAKKVHTQGIDAEVILRPVDGLTITTNAGLLQTRIDQFLSSVSPYQTDFSGNQLPLSPRFSFSGIIDYKHPVGPGTVDFLFSANYKSHQYFDVSNDPYITQKGYWIDNIQVSYALPGGHWEAGVFVRNLTDQKYLLDAFDLISPFGFIQGIEGQPRMFGGMINYRY